MSPSADWEIRILGPLEVVQQGAAPTTLARSKERALVAALALDAGETVSIAGLLETLWGASPPETALNALQVYVSSVRKLFGETGRQVIRTEPTGYRLSLDDCTVDLRRFEAAVRRARQELADGRRDRAADDLRAALGLWRGRPLEDAELAGDASFRLAQIDDLRIAALEDVVGAELALGRHVQLVPELERLIAEQPLHEGFRTQLMLALYRSGRQGDALELYRTTRETFLDTIGVEPGPELRELERAILNHEPSLGLVEQPPTPRRRKTVVVAQSVVDVDSGLDPEALHELLAPIVERLAATYQRAGARVETHAEGVLAVFGFPAMREDEPLRAARAALSAHEETRALDSGGLDVRTGLAIGTALVGETDALPLSQPSRRALRLAIGADAGQILVDAALYRAIGSAAAVDAATADAVALSGVDLGPRKGSTIPLVGRRRELAWLRGVLGDALRLRSCVAAAVVGEPGIGKTRLAGEARTLLARQALVLYGRCRDQVGDPYLPLRELLEGLDPSAAGALETVGADADVAAVFAAALEQHAGGKAVVLLVDDVHWAEPGFRDALERLPPALAHRPVALVALTRPEGAEALWWARRLTVPPLDAVESRDLILELGASAELAEQLHARAGGNPLFLEQLLASGEHDAVPPTLEALLNARLDLVPADERRVLEAASAVNGEFAPEVLERVLGASRRDLAAHLRSLCERRLLTEVEGNRAVYAFRHQLIRDVTYESLPRRERATLHERLADILEERGGDAAAIGLHLEAAHDYADDDVRTLARRAAHHLELAGRLAYVRGDNPSAQNLLSRAIALSGDERRPELLADLGEVLRERGEFDAAFDALAQAEAATADEVLRAQIVIRRLRLEMSARPFRDSATQQRQLDAAMRRLEEADDRRSLAEAWLIRARTLWIHCRAEDTDAAVLTALGHAREAGARQTPGARRIENQCLHQRLGALVFGPTRVDDAVEACLGILETPGANDRVRASAHRALAALRAMQGRFDEARASLELDRELGAKLGLKLVFGGRAEIGAMIELLAGRPDAAAATLADGIQTLEDVHEMAARPTLYALLGEVLWRDGRREEATRAVEHAAAAASEADLTTQVQWRVVAAKLGLGDAVQTAMDAVEIAGSTDFLNLQAEAHLALALALRTGDPQGARRARAAARRAFAAKGNVAALDALGRRSRARR